MGGDTAAPQTNRSRHAGARAARHADALPHRGRRLELLPRGAGDINAPDSAERTRRPSPRDFSPLARRRGFLAAGGWNGDLYLQCDSTYHAG